MLLVAAAQDEVEQDEGEGQDASSLGDQEDDDTVHVLEPVKVSMAAVVCLLCQLQSSVAGCPSAPCHAGHVLEPVRIGELWGALTACSCRSVEWGWTLHRQQTALSKAMQLPWDALVPALCSSVRDGCDAPVPVSNRTTASPLYFCGTLTLVM